MVYKILFGFLLLVSNLFASFSFDELKSFKANFTQKVTNESNKTVEYSGELFIKNNGKVLWKYVQPVPKNVYVIGKVVIVDEPELEQAVFTTLENSIDMVSMLQNAKKIDEKNYITKLNNVDYKISIKNEKIDSISYKDGLENSIFIQFDNALQNITIAEDTFMFLAPDYYDIIKK